MQVYTVATGEHPPVYFPEPWTTAESNACFSCFFDRHFQSPGCKPGGSPLHCGIVGVRSHRAPSYTVGKDIQVLLCLVIGGTFINDGFDYGILCRHFRGKCKKTYC